LVMRKILGLNLCLILLVSNLAFAGGRAMQNKILSQGGMICGRVFIPPNPGSSGGEQVPAVGAQVVLQNTNFRTTTDSSGAFQIINLPAGNYAVMASKDSYGPATKTVEVKKSGVCNVYLTLGAGGMPNISLSGPIASNTVYIAFASTVVQPVQSTGNFTPGVSPQVGSMTSFGVLSQMQYSADPFSIGGGNPTISPAPTMPDSTMQNNMPMSQGTLPPNMANPWESQMMTTTNPNNLMLLDPYDIQKVSYVALQNKPYWLCFNVSGTKLLVSTDGGFIEIYDLLSNNTKVASIPTQGAVSEMVANPKGGQVFAAVKGAVPLILTISTTNNTLESRIPAPVLRNGAPGLPSALAVSPDGKRLYVALVPVSGGPGEVAVLDLAGQSLLGNIPVGDMPQGIALAPDGKTLYVSNYNSASISVIDTGVLAETMRLRVGVQPVKLVLTADGGKLYVTENGSNDVVVINTRTGRVMANVAVGRAPIGVAITSDSKKVFVANNGDGTISVIDTQQDIVVRTTQPLPRSVPFGVVIKP
jgi:YVTN family beta-propeller protein